MADAGSISMHAEYLSFLRGKRIEVEPVGFDADEVMPGLFDWQESVVRWAIRKGRAALFLDTGLGKTACQLAWADAVRRHCRMPVLIVAPLAVSQQTIREGRKFGLTVRYAKSSEDIDTASDFLYVTNYERVDRFDPGVFSGVVLDESSILKSFMGKTKRALVGMFENTAYKLACTATPSPNDHMEILNQAEWLGIMDPPKALSIWFINDTMNFGTYRLKGYAADDFFRWLSSWAVGIHTPSQIGYSDDGYILPCMTVHEHIVTVDETESSGDYLFRFADMSATGYNREKRLTMADRVQKVAEIVAGENGQWLVWCELNDESAALKQSIPDAVEIKGSDLAERKEQAAIDFIDGKIRVLISKASIFGYGLNFQNCHNVAFCGLSYSYENYYQAVRRVWRFGQQHEVSVHVVIAHTERNTLAVVTRKRDTHDYFRTHFVNELSTEEYRRRYRLDYDRNHNMRLPAFMKESA